MRWTAVIVGVLETDEILPDRQFRSDVRIGRVVMIIVHRHNVATMIKQSQQAVQTRIMTTSQDVDRDAVRIGNVEREHIHVLVAVDLSIDRLRDLDRLSLLKTIIRFAVSDERMDAADQQLMRWTFTRR